ncbi:hypothetical protein NKH99_30455 [Mesorhizobium sp. M0854]|uniref:hypothetical protein n=1 Tax=Mesorhizobium sp. M0854 TaxID=2957013 RepID=UPI00333D6EE6
MSVSTRRPTTDWMRSSPRRLTIGKLGSPGCENPAPRVGSAWLVDILDKIELVRGTGANAVVTDGRYESRLAQFAREGTRYTAQAFQQTGPAPRRVILVATLREIEATLTDAAIGMFGSLIGRAHLRARKRIEQTIAASADQGRDRLIRVAGVLEAVSKAARAGGDIAAAVAAVASPDTIDADAVLIRRTTRPGRGNAISEIAPEHRAFKRSGPRFLRAFSFEGRNGTAPLRAGIWVPTSRLHRSLDTLLAPSADATPSQIGQISDPHAWLDARAAELDAALLGVSRGLPNGDPALFTGDRLRFPKEPKTDLAERDDGRRLALNYYGLVPTTRITDVLSQVERWTGFTAHFGMSRPAAHKIPIRLPTLEEVSNRVPSSG